MIKIMLSLFFLGLSFATGPCLASCGPLLLTYNAGTKKNILKSLSAYFLFSLARISVYIALSLIFFFLGKLLIERWSGGFSKYVLVTGGIFIILIGILTATGKKFAFLHFLYKRLLERDKKSIFIMGLIFGLLPCAPLLVTFSYVFLVSKTWFENLLYMFSFGLGTLISPLLLLNILSGLIPYLMKAKEIYYQIFCFACGLMLVFLGIQFIRRVW